MKKVIFIGALRYSGSTMLELILSNDPVGFSVGEMSALIKRKGRVACSCNEEPCPIWPKVQERGLDTAYQTIFADFPDTTFIVDSSKSPIWIKRMAGIAEKMGFEVSHLLIWKDPGDSATSYNKRGYLDQWKEEWIHYHRLYLSVVKDFKALNYREFVSNPGCLKDVCKYLDINFFENKHEYWNKQHHSIGGNGSTKIHLYDKDSKTFDQINEHMKKKSSDHELSQRHRSVFVPDVPEDVKAFVDEQTRGDQLIANITSVLKQQSVLESTDQSQADLKSIKPYGSAYIWSRSMMSLLKQKYLER